jgi:hypothetical protein
VHTFPFKDSLAFLFRRLPIADGITEEADDKCAYNCDRDHGFGSSLFVSLLMVLCDRIYLPISGDDVSEKFDLFAARFQTADVFSGS